MWQAAAADVATSRAEVEAVASELKTILAEQLPELLLLATVSPNAVAEAAADADTDALDASLLGADRTPLVDDHDLDGTDDRGSEGKD